jgi:hypothetical protein
MPSKTGKRKAPEEIPAAFVEWQAARLAAGKVAPVFGKGNFDAARKLEKLIPDAAERQPVMTAFFKLPDERGWLAGRGHALWQLVNHRLDEARQAAADVKPTTTLDTALLTNAADRVKDRFGEALAKRFFDRGLEFGSIQAAQTWLTAELERSHAG